MTDRPGDEAPPIEVEAVIDGPANEEAAGILDTTARRRGRLLLLLWLLPAAIILVFGYLVAAEPERLAAFLSGKPPDVASVTDLQNLAERVRAVQAGSVDRAQVEAQADAIASNRRTTEAASTALATLREALDVFERRLQVMEKRLTLLEVQPLDKAVADPVVDPMLLAPLEAAMASLASRLDGLEADDRVAAADRALAELAVLRDAIADLARSGEQGAAAKLAVARLRFTVDSGQPFGEELEALRAAGDPGLGSWTAHAGQGLPTASTLVRRFKALARARTLRPEDATGAPWLDNAIQRLSDVVSIRRVSRDLVGDDIDAVLGRAEAHIKEGDLAGAVAELIGDLPLPFEGWRLIAQDRLAADAELRALIARNGG